MQLPCTYREVLNPACEVLHQPFYHEYTAVTVCDKELVDTHLVTFIARFHYVVKKLQLGAIKASNILVKAIPIK